MGVALTNEQLDFNTQQNRILANLAMAVALPDGQLGALFAFHPDKTLCRSAGGSFLVASRIMLRCAFGFHRLRKSAS